MANSVGILNEEEKLALKYYVKRPEDSASSFITFATSLAETPGIKFGCILDNFIIPNRSGRVTGLVGRPGHGKTSVGAALLTNEAKRLMKSPEEKNRYALHVSWEQVSEELETMYMVSTGTIPNANSSDIWWGRVDEQKLIEGAIKRPNLPVWIFAESINGSNFDAPPMTIDIVYAGIAAAYKLWDMLPSIIFIDYIQDVPVPDERDRASQVAKAMRLVKRLAVHAKCPVVLGIQADRETDKEKERAISTGKAPIPEAHNCQWSSVIEQKLDTGLSLWIPTKSWTPKEKPSIKVEGVSYENNSNLLVVKLWKQRGDIGYGIWPLWFDASRLIIADYPKMRF